MFFARVLCRLGEKGVYMYWLLDVAIVALFVLVFVEGFRKGIFGMLLGVGAFFLRFIYTILVAAIVVAIFQFTGLVDALTVPLAKGLGESSLYDTAMVANILALAIFFVIGITVAIITLFFIVKAVRKHVILKGSQPFVVSRIFGIIVGEAVYCAFLLVVFGFIHGVVEAGGLPATFELITACPISGFIYRINPLNPVFEQIGYIVYNVFSGNFGALMGK